LAVDGDAFDATFQIELPAKAGHYKLFLKWNSRKLLAHNCDWSHRPGNFHERLEVRPRQ
jgi:hypothetical protein